MSNSLTPSIISEFQDGTTVPVVPVSGSPGKSLIQS